VVNKLFPPKKTTPSKPNKPTKKDDSAPNDSKNTKPTEEQPKPVEAEKPPTEKQDPQTDESDKKSPPPDDKPTAEEPKKPESADTKEEPDSKKTNITQQKWRAAIVAWYKTSLAPGAKKVGPWIKDQAKALWQAAKKAQADFKKSREEKKKKAEEELKNPSPATLKWVSMDPYGSFGYDGFNLHKGLKKDPMPPNADPMDPEKHFKSRTDVRTEPPVVEKKKKESATTIAKIGGVPSSRISRFAMPFTHLAEHDHTLKNMLQNGGISFLAHTFPGSHEILPAFVRSNKLVPLGFTFKPDDINANGKRFLFLLNANILQYLVSHCIAYKNIKTGLRKALWDDTNTRNLCLVAACAHLFKKDGIGRKGLNKLSGKLKPIAIGLLAVIVAKIMLDQLLESRNLIFEIKQELSAKSEALGIKEGYLPQEMRGNRYIIFNSTTSKATCFIATCLNGAYHGVSASITAKSPADSLAYSAATALIFAIKAVFSIKNTYLLESDLQYLSQNLKERVTQHVTSHKILATMSYAIGLATFSQTALKTPYIIQQLRAKKPKAFSVATLETLKTGLPKHIRKQIDVDAEQITDYSQYGNNYPLFRDLCIKLVLLNIQQSTDAHYAATQEIVADLLANKRPKLLTRLERFNNSYLYWVPKKTTENDAAFKARIEKCLMDLNNASSPVFTTEFTNPRDKKITQTMMDLLAKDILENDAAFRE